MSIRPLRNRRVIAPRLGERSLPSTEPGTPSPGDSVDIPESEVPTWEEVARTNGGFLYSVAYRLTGNQDDAADLVQEVLLRVRRGLATYQPGSMEAWLSRIMTNVFLDEVRRRRRRPVEALPDESELGLPAAAAADEVLDGQSLSGDVQLALLHLPDEFRAAVVLCDVVGLSYAQIAETLGVPLGTVRSRIHRGRGLLREVLG